MFMMFSVFVSTIFFYLQTYNMQIIVFMGVLIMIACDWVPGIQAKPHSHVFTFDILPH